MNKIAFYEDKKALKAIQKAERRRHYAEARTLLTQYVGQFGIENFYRNTELLWHLGQLLQRDSASGRSQELAKTYFRLALKHHRTDVRRVQLYYDSLEEKTADLYVPLKVYYEVVEYRKSLNTFHPPKNVYTNMGDAINSKFPDYGPALGAGDSLLLFSSKRQVGKGVRAKVDENLYVSRREGPRTGLMLSRCPSPSARSTMRARPASRAMGAPFSSPVASAPPATATATSSPPHSARMASGASPRALARS
ncbi:MAG: hypothetical protein WKG07_39825 [Hymenobacter sp.]